jgi:acyl-coenzyme A synthetase/AMP-(fatty) acid ligase
MRGIMGELNYIEKCEQWKWNIPEYYNIGYDCVDKHAEGKNKNKIALLYENEIGEKKQFTYGELKILSNKFGNVLRNLDLKKGDRFLIRVPDIPEFQITFIGGVKIGMVPIPSSVMFRGKEVEYRINDSKAKVVVTTSKYVKEVNEVKDNCPSLNHIIVVDKPGKNEISFKKQMNNASALLELEKTKSSDMAFFCYTSGTTGDPKGAVHLHRWVPGNDPSVLYWQDTREDDIIAHTGNLSWIFPLGNGFLYVWRWGLTTLIYDGVFSPEKWFELIEKYRITNLASVPTCYRMFLTVKNAENIYNISSLRHCISAGEPLNPEVIKEWKRRFSLEIYDGIGMTEIMVYLSNMKNMNIKPGSCGKPQPGKICDIVDENGNSLPKWEPGILAVNKDDPGLFKEYWNKPKKTSQSFKNNWFLTGDVLYKDDDDYFWFSGRNDDLIMASGYRISPFEVESAIISHPDVLEAAVIASPDEIRGVIVKAYIKLQSPEKASNSLIKEIQDHTKFVAAPYKYPREIEFVNELPKTQSGKIKRRVLREQEQKRKGGM